MTWSFNQIEGDRNSDMYLSSNPKGMSERVYGREQLQDTTKFDLIGVLLASSAFLTTVGAGLSAWFVIDAAARYKQLIDTVGEYKRLSVDDEEGN